MWNKDKDLFDELAEKCGNRYLAVMYVARLSRKLGSSIPGSILDSEMITWALRGEKPNVQANFRRLYSANPDLQLMEWYLDYVQDEAVVHEVRKNYVQSVKSHHLVYIYNDEITPYQNQRALILLRMIWYEFQLE